MTEAQGPQAHEQGTAARAGATIDRWGAQLGLLALGAGEQLRGLAARVGTDEGGTASPAPPTTGTGAGADTPGTPAPPPTARADAALDRAGERLGGFLARAGRQLRRAAARTREEAEDMVAEAEAVRRGPRP